MEEKKKAKNETEPLKEDQMDMLNRKKEAITQSAVAIVSLLEEVNISGQRNMELLLQAMNQAQNIIGTAHNWPTFAKGKEE